MAIVNITPDSFSGDGLLHNEANIMAHIDKLLQDGADCLDLGAESTRPGAQILSQGDEWSRLKPILQLVRKKYPYLPISVDTYKPKTAQLALEHGANIINDIHGLDDSEMIHAAQLADGVIIMHNNAKNRIIKNQSYNVDKKNAGNIKEICDYFDHKLAQLRQYGFDKERIIIDPGLGFGKSITQSCAIINDLAIFNKLGAKTLIGASRKSFIGKITGRPINERMAGSLAVMAGAFYANTNIVRVHDVRETHDFHTTMAQMHHGNQTQCFIALGSNLGDKNTNLQRAIIAMGQLGVVGQQSTIHITENPYLPNEPLFANMVVELTTQLEPHELLESLKAIEREMGRDFTAPRNSARIIDLDIIVYGNLVMQSDNLQIPHAMSQQRDFVLKPMHDIAPHYRFRDTGHSVAELLIK